jgi:DNA-binding XRE family transcriptional regulator
MNGQMKVNGSLVRALREEKSWSQEHLARASGLSERTIQRVEVEGLGSAETRLALAAALGVPVSDLFAGPSSSVPAAYVARRLPLWGWIGWGVGVASSMAVLGLGYVEGVFALDRVAVNMLPWLALLGICAGVIATRTRWRREQQNPEN